MSRDSKDKVNGLILEIDGITGYFPKPFIVEAIKTYMGKSDRKALINEIVELSEENETLKDNNEHLAVMLEEAKADVVPKSEVEILIYKLECLLCHATGGRLSKHTYDLRTMETVVTDCINETYNDGYGEGYKDCAREIFEEIEFEIHQLDFDREETRAIAIEGIIAQLKKKYTGADIDG